MAGLIACVDLDHAIPKGVGLNYSTPKGVDLDKLDLDHAIPKGVDLDYLIPKGVDVNYSIPKGVDPMNSVCCPRGVRGPEKGCHMGKDGIRSLLCNTGLVFDSILLPRSTIEGYIS